MAFDVPALSPVFASRGGLRTLLPVVCFGLALVVAGRVESTAPDSHDAADEYYDSHFHLTNYIQQGIGIHDFLGIMGRRVGRSLSKEAQARFDPMITGFDPADMYAVDHIRRVLQIYPGVFSGIGEFTIHKEFVSAKVAGGA